MSWREQLKTEASFRGVPFKTVDADQRIGRRTVLHEYPQRDEPFTEDMGRRARQFTVEAYVIGEDYLQRRDALMRALEEPGPGQLVHPRYGVRQVAVLEAVPVKESAREGGLARFSITFVEHGGNVFPKPVDDTAARVESTAAAVDAETTRDFGSGFNTEGAGLLGEQALKDLQKDLNGYLKTARQVSSTASLSALVSRVSGVSGSLSSLIKTPVTLAQSVVSLSVQLTQAVQRPFSALAELESVFFSNRRPTTTARTGSTRARLVANESARADLQRRVALTGQARMLSAVLYDFNGSATQARALRDRLLDQIDAELEQYDPPAPLARELVGLRGAITRDVQQRAELLRETSTFTPMAVLPSVVLAHRIYQDADRADELVARNDVRHPAFVPARPLEVLR